MVDVGHALTQVKWLTYVVLFLEPNSICHALTSVKWSACCAFDRVKWPSYVVLLLMSNGQHRSSIPKFTRIHLVAVFIRVFFPSAENTFDVFLAMTGKVVCSDILLSII